MDPNRRRAGLFLQHVIECDVAEARLTLLWVVQKGAQEHKFCLKRTHG